MIRAGGWWAVAARSPGGATTTHRALVPEWAGRLRRVPLARGAIALFATVALGMRALSWSRAVADGDDGRPPSKMAVALATLTSVAILVAMFAVLHAVAARAVTTGSEWFFAAVEAVVRLGLLVAYVAAIGRLAAIRRTFEYHGAEHQAVAAFEAGAPVEVPRVSTFSPRHARCGTDFLVARGAGRGGRLRPPVSGAVVGVAGKPSPVAPSGCGPGLRTAPGFRSSRRPGLAGAPAGARSGRAAAHHPPPSLDQVEVAIAAVRVALGEEPLPPAPTSLTSLGRDRAATVESTQPSAASPARSVTPAGAPVELAQPLLRPGCISLVESERDRGWRVVDAFAGAVTSNAFHVGLLLTAFGFGFRHGIDWDHIAALTDITSSQDEGRRSMRFASLYALGHALVVFALGSAAIVLAARLPSGVDAIMERFVGVTLVVLGVYVIYALVKHGRDFRLRSRWMLLFSGARRALRWARRHRSIHGPVEIVHDHVHSPAEVHNHDHMPAVVGRDRASNPLHAHRHRHVAAMPEDPFQNSGKATSFTVGMIHGIGAETPTQVVIFLTAAGAGGRGVGLLLLVCFVVGLVASNTVIALAGTFGFLGATRNFKLYAAVSVLTATFSLAIGTMFLFGRGAALPAMFGG